MVGHIAYWITIRIVFSGGIPDDKSMTNPKIPNLSHACCFCACMAIVSVAASKSVADEFRVTTGLQVLYDFRGTGDIIKDISDSGSQIDLKISTPKTVVRKDGTLKISGVPVIQTETAVNELVVAIRNSNQLTVEAWCHPKDTKQAGPARLITLSKDSSNRNFTLGQDGNKFDARLRTTKTSTNGIPSVASPGNSVTQSLMHVIYTRSQDGTTRIFVNGKQIEQKQVKGDLSNWDKSYRLSIADEFSGGRPWLGSLHLVAIYSRALSSEEVTQNFVAGPNGKPSPELIAKRQHAAAARHFETAVAPILARHCLECHDSANNANGLDLSKKVAAFKGGANGKSIVPGNSADSELWTSVEEDLMPHERAPLSADEKAVLKKWIDDGATWTLAEIDPAIYAHSGNNQSFVQRLTISEYIETVKAAVGIDITEEATKLLPPDMRADGFSNTAYNLNVDLKHVGAYAKLAEVIVSKLDVEGFVARFSKRRKFTDNDMEDVISKVGKWILRGPVSKREVIAYRGITTTVASAGGTFDEAMGFVIEAMLQSPRFMYRVESQRGDGTAIPINDYELASRMSYIIWGGPPDEELLKAADEGKLADNITAQTARLLQHPKAVQQSLRFVSDWLNLNRMQNLRPNAQRFPNWNPELAADMADETRAYFEEIVWHQNKPLTALMNSQVTFATPRLAKFYAIDSAIAAVPSGPFNDSRFQLSTFRGSSASTPQRYDLAKVPGRGGLLTHGSVLTVGGDDASMVTRGLLVMHELLRGVVNDPPPCVDTTPIPTKPGLTQRSIAMDRINNATCGGCHSKFEPLAFGLEKFDGIGAYHDKDEHGNVLRDDGEILVPGSATAVKYSTSAQLMDFLASSDRVSQSFTWKITQFALGRPLVAEDAATVDKIHTEATSSGGTWSAVITAIINSDLVMLTRTQN